MAAASSYNIFCPTEKQYKAEKLKLKFNSQFKILFKNALKKSFFLVVGFMSFYLKIVKKKKYIKKGKFEEEILLLYVPNLLIPRRNLILRASDINIQYLFNL